MKTAKEILFEYGINTMNLNDDFNTQLLFAMAEHGRLIAELSFDAGNKHGFDIAENNGNATIYPNKEKFISELFEDK